MNICHITVSGRLTGDAKLGKSESGSDFARFTIARNRKNRDGEEVAEFYSCVWFGKYATKAAEGLKKGAKAVVDGDFTVAHTIATTPRCLESRWMFESTHATCSACRDRPSRTAAPGTAH